MAINTVPVEMAWNVYAGDRNIVVFELAAEDNPLDLTQGALQAQARGSCTDPVPALVATITMTEAALGRFSVEWDGEEVRSLLAGEDKWAGVWDLQVFLPADGRLPTTILRGAFTATCDVTRDEGAPG